MAEYLSVPWQKVLPDDELTDIQLALVEPMTVGFHAIDNGQVTDLDTVMVFGCGMIGSGAVVRAKLRGATVIAVDIDDSKLETARKLGAEYTINSMTQNLHEKLEKITRSNGPSVVIEAAGNPASYRSAIEEVAFAGRVICIGYAGNEIAFPTKLWVQKEMEIMGSRNANPSDFESVIKFLKNADLDDQLLISKIVSLYEAPAEMQNWSENSARIMKILVQF
jgi:threonine dehydrogenase-like Zn-dependent dehydrogenase